MSVKPYNTSVIQHNKTSVNYNINTTKLCTAQK